MVLCWVLMAAFVSLALGDNCKLRVALAVDVSGSMAQTLANLNGGGGGGGPGNSSKVTGTFRDELAHLIGQDLFAQRSDDTAAVSGVCVALYRFATKTELVVDYVMYAQPILDALESLQMELAHPDYYTNWEDAITVMCLRPTPPPDVAYLITDGLPSTRMDCQTENQPCDDYAVDMDAAVRAAKRAYSTAGVRLVPVAVGKSIPDGALASLCGACASTKCQLGVDFFRLDPLTGIPDSPSRVFNLPGVGSDTETTTATTLVPTVDTTAGSTAETTAGTTAETTAGTTAETTTGTTAETTAGTTVETNAELTTTNAETTEATIAETVAETTTGSVAETVAETIMGSVAETTAGSVADTVAETTTGAVADTVAETTTGAAIDTVAETTAETVSETTEEIATTAPPATLVATTRRTRPHSTRPRTHSTTTVTTAETTTEGTTTEGTTTTTAEPTTIQGTTTQATTETTTETTTEATTQATTETTTETTTTTTPAPAPAVESPEVPAPIPTPTTTAPLPPVPATTTKGPSVMHLQPHPEPHPSTTKKPRPLPVGGHARPGHDQAHPEAPPHPSAPPVGHRHARKRNTALAIAKDEREVHGDNWVAIVVVGIVFGVFLLIVFIVICCVSHGGKGGVEQASWEPTAENTETDNDNVEGRYKSHYGGVLKAQVLSDHLSSVSTGMVFTVARKFDPTGKKLE